MEGVEYYKGCPYNKAPPYEFGIYSIKQREMFKSTNGNGVQNVPKGKQTLDGSNVMTLAMKNDESNQNLNLQKIQTFKSPNWKIAYKIFRKKWTQWNWTILMRPQQKHYPYPYRLRTVNFCIVMKTRTPHQHCRAAWPLVCRQGEKWSHRPRPISTITTIASTRVAPIQRHKVIPWIK